MNIIIPVVTVIGMYCSFQRTFYFRMILCKDKKQKEKKKANSVSDSFK